MNTLQKSFAVIADFVAVSDLINEICAEQGYVEHLLPDSTVLNSLEGVYFFNDLNEQALEQLDLIHQ